MPEQLNRRDLLLSSACAAAGLSLGADGAAAQATLPPTPSCADGAAATQAQTEGPFFKPRSPQRADLREAGVGGRPVELSGQVLSRSCKPVAGALVDLWHADDKGQYDDRGFRCRGHVFADADGRYRFLTIMPALYPGRTRHFHVKVQAPNRPVLTTQLYFPADEQANRRDGLFRRELLMQVTQANEAFSARFDFVLDIG